MAEKMNENDLENVAGGVKSEDGREIVTPQTKCMCGLKSNLIAVSINRETGERTEQTFPRNCGECEFMSDEDGVCYCNYEGPVVKDL